jgi:hypothetical protein
MSVARQLVVWVLATCCSLWTAASFAQVQHQPSSSQEDSLRKFLRNYVGNSDEGKATRYSSAFLDLNDDGAVEVIVYLTGNGWCGTGGCTSLVLAPEGPSYRVVAKITATRPPIRVLASTSKGWHDISVVARVNAVEPTYEAILSFDGKSYPGNPSIPPARKRVGAAGGKIVVPYASEGTSLYP